MSNTSIDQLSPTAETSRSAAKRSFRPSGDNESGEDNINVTNKRTRNEDLASLPTSKTSTAQQVYHTMKGYYDFNIPFLQFLGLLGYLCAILQWGYSILESDMDLFIYLYPSFEIDRLRVEALRLVTPTISIPSYHQWFARHRMESVEQSRAVLNEQILREIWKEYPHTFLRAEWRLRAIAARALESTQKNVS